MSKVRVAIPEELRLDVIERCNNRCCICQTPFIVIHHINEDLPHTTSLTTWRRYAPTVTAKRIRPRN